MLRVREIHAGYCFEHLCGLWSGALTLRLYLAPWDGMAFNIPMLMHRTSI